MSRAFEKGNAVTLIVSKLPKALQANLNHPGETIDVRIVARLHGIEEHILVGFGELRYIINKCDLVKASQINEDIESIWW
jgi:hypothetical protein